MLSPIRRKGGSLCRGRSKYREDLDNERWVRADWRGSAIWFLILQFEKKTCSFIKGDVAPRDKREEYRAPDDQERSLYFSRIRPVTPITKNVVRNQPAAICPQRNHRKKVGEMTDLRYFASQPTGLSGGAWMSGEGPHLSCIPNFTRGNAFSTEYANT